MSNYFLSNSNIMPLKIDPDFFMTTALRKLHSGTCKWPSLMWAAFSFLIFNLNVLRLFLPGVVGQLDISAKTV